MDAKRYPIYLTDDEIIKITIALETLAEIFGRVKTEPNIERRNELYAMSLEIKSQHLTCKG